VTTVFDHARRSRWWLQVPFGLVLMVALIGFLRVWLQHWREGSFLLGCAFLLAAAFRAVLASERVGMLAIRSRVVDVVLFGVLGLLIVAVAMTITGGPFGH
jgi:hypothetical protein